jgi:hypothetical protein
MPGPTVLPFGATGADNAANARGPEGEAAVHGDGVQAHARLTARTVRTHRQYPWWFGVGGLDADFGAPISTELTAWIVRPTPRKEWLGDK